MRNRTHLRAARARSGRMAKRAPWRRRLGRWIVALALFASAPAACALMAGATEAEAAASLPDHLVNGDFSYPTDAQMRAAGCSLTGADSIYVDVEGGNVVYHHALRPIPGYDRAKMGWTSTQPYVSDANWTVPAGTMQVADYSVSMDLAHIAELACHTPSSIYQDVATTPGAVYKWTLRQASFTSAKVDRMSVMIGTTSSQSAQRVWRTTSNGTDATGYVGTVFGSSGTRSWETYAGTYEVPAGQTVTRFTFKAVDTYLAESGCYLDDVVFRASYPVVYDLGGGSLSGVPTSVAAAKASDYAGYVIEGDSVSLAGKRPTRSGYTFLGWSKSKVADISTSAAYEAAKPKLVSGITVAEGTNTVHAVWGKNPTVVFTDGMGATLKAQTVAFNASATAPASPTRTGYTFDGWSGSYANVRSSIAISAKWDANPYAIRYDANGGTGSMPDQAMTYDVAGSVRPCAFERPGYTFWGWCSAPVREAGAGYAAGERVINLAAARNATVTLYAMWMEDPHVTWSDGWGDVLKEEVVGYDRTAAYPDAPSRKGYVFCGWSHDPEQAFHESCTVYAHWRACDYRIAFDACGGTGSMDAIDMLCDVEQSLPACAFERAGYAFRGWALSEGGPVELADGAKIKDLTLTEGETVTLFAVWRALPYTVAFDGCGGTGRMDEVACECGTAQPLPRCSYSMAGHAFRGWALAEGGPVAFADGAAVLDLTLTEGATVTLFAVWDEDADVLVTYAAADPLRCSVTVPSETAAPATGSVSGSRMVPAAGWRVSHWEDAAGNVVAVQRDVIPQRGADGLWHAATYYAVVEPISYTVAFDGSGAMGSMRSQAMPFGELGALRPCAFQRAGHEFCGWALEEGGEVAYLDAETVRDLSAVDGATVTLHAVWEPASCTVAFDANGGTGQMADLALARGGSAGLPECAFEREGFSFRGWSTSPDGTGLRLAGGQEVRGAGDATLYALWEEDAAWVAFDANGAKGEMGPMRLADGATMPECAFTREGYEFAYWCKRADGASRGWAAGDPADGLGSCTLYAIWVADGEEADVPGEADAEADAPSEPTGGQAASAPAGSPWDKLGGSWAPALAAASGGSAAWAACMAIAACAAGRREM